MGNILCLPKKERRPRSGSGKKKGKRSSKNNRQSDSIIEEEKTAASFAKDHKPPNESDKASCSKTSDVYVCPVVSSSILLRYDDEESDEAQNKRSHAESTHDTPHVEPESTEPGALSISNVANKALPPCKDTCITEELECEKVSANAQNMIGKEEPTSNVKVIEVQEVSRSTRTEPSLVDEIHGASVQPSNESQDEKGVIEESVITVPVASFKVIEVQEASTSLVSRPKDLPQQSNTKGPREYTASVNVLNQHLNQLVKEETTLAPLDVITDKRKIERSRFKVEKVFEASHDQSVEDLGNNDKLEKMSKQERPVLISELNNKSFVEKTSKHTDNTGINIQVVQPSAAKNALKITKSIENSTNENLKLSQKSESSEISTHSAVNHVGSNTLTEKKSVQAKVEDETHARENKIKGAVSCPAVPARRPVSSHIKEFSALLEVLSALKIPEKKPVSDHSVPVSINKAHTFGPQTESSDKHGVYKSKHGIENWIHQSKAGMSSPTTLDSNTSIPSTSTKKVSDFTVPKKARKPSPKPLVLKKPSPHLYSIPGIAKSDPDNKVNWTQIEAKGPQAEVLWTTKPTAFDVKLPPLPKRLLERKGSVEKLQESWVIPQVKQIETLKREYGRFPGIVVPAGLRHKFSVEIKKETDTVDGEENDCVDTDTDVAKDATEDVNNYNYKDLNGKDRGLNKN